MARRKDFQLEGALGLVTGAGSGIGRATALALAGHGVRVLAADVDGEAADKTALDCDEVGAEAHGLACDVGDPDAVAAMAERVEGEWSTLDILVNNAGVGMSARLSDMSVADWQWIRRVNLDGVVHCCMAFGPPMVDRGHGHVVNMASILAYTHHATVPAYSATKAAVLALSECLRADWGPKGVGVSAVCPGLVNTAIAEHTRYLGMDESRRAQITKVFRRGRSPELVALEVVRAIREDLIMVPVGWEARVAWWSQRLLPLRLHQFVARR